MNLNDKTTKITETAIITAIMALFIIVGLYIMPIIFLLFPVPFIILGARHDIRYSILSVIASCLIVGMLVDFFTGIFIFISLGSIALALTYMINKKYKPDKIIIAGTIISIVASVIVILIIGYITDINFMNQLETISSEILDANTEIIRNMNLAENEVSEIIDIMNQSINYTLLALPSMLIIFSLFVTYINYWVSVAILKRLGHTVIQIPKFKNFRLPENIIWGTTVIFICIAFIRYLKFFYYDTIFLNVVILSIFIFFIQGFSVIIYLMDKVKLNKILKGILIFLIIIYVPMSLLIALIGVFDAIFNFRKIGKSNKS